MLLPVYQRQKYSYSYEVETGHKSCSETSVYEQLPLKNSKIRSILQDL